MSGHEEQQLPNEARDDNIIGSSVVLPVAHPNLLDYIYSSGISLLPLYGGGVGGGGGGVSWNQYNDMEQAMASILAGSLYERNPVKKVIDEEACQEIKEHAFTAALVEEMKINSACGIWQEDFEEGEAIKILPCNHAFKAEAITKWLKEEKAECPMCRFVLKSKEHVCRENDNDDDDDDDDEDIEMHGNDYAGAGAAHAEPEPELNNEVVRINNIASRLVQSVAGRVSHYQDNLPRYYDESISVPISRLIESRRNLISQARNLAVARAAIPSSGGAAAAAGAGGGMWARASPVIRDDNRINNNNNNNNNNNRIDDNNNNNNNNNNRIDDNNNNNNNNNRIDDNNNNNNRVNDINPPILNIINNNYYYNNNNDDNNYHIHVDEMHQDFVSNQEQADIEEAIRRSLE